MDNKRLILLFIFGFSLLMLWNGWQKQHQPSSSKVVSATQQIESQSDDIPMPSSISINALPTALDREKNNEVNDAVTTATIKTDLMIAQISSLGGNLTDLSFIEQKSTEDINENFILFDADGNHRYMARSGLIGEKLPNHKTNFTLIPGTYELKPGMNELQVHLEAPERNGVKVSKIYTFHRNSYVIDIKFEVSNQTLNEFSTYTYFQLVRDGTPPEGGSMMVSTFTGPSIYTDETKFKKIKFDDIETIDSKFTKQAHDGWVAMVQHYFVAALLPPNGIKREYRVEKLESNLYSASVILPLVVAPGEKINVNVPLYAGPQEQDKLEKIMPGLRLVVDYGWLAIIAVPIFSILEILHGFVGNWGWAIILLTILIKLVFYPLSATSYRSMAKMKLVTPKLMKIKELYSNDRLRMNQEMMELYKRENINPLGGCLPILIQIPVFIALYWVLLGSVEMRHAPWIGWITDLSARDPYYILPLLMGATMFLQSKLNPTPPDPIQAKVMMAMPVVFTIMFLWFPAGLVLYWTVNNVLSIAQQWRISRVLEGEKKLKSA